MPRPTPDHSTGWWSIRVRMPDGKRKKFMLAKQPGWAPGKRLPKKPPADVEMLARKYQDMDKQIRHGVDVSVTRADDLAAFLADYQDHHAREHRPNSVRVLRQSVAHFLRFCEHRGVKTVQAVGVTVVEEYMKARRKAGAARGTVHVEKGCLSPAWTRAVRGRSLAENPWKLVPTPGKPSKEEPEFWTADEVARLVAAADGWVRDLVLVALNCGGRVTSLLTLEWDDVRFDRGVVKLTSKTGAYEVPMSAVLRDVLERRRFTSKDRLVFPGRVPGKPRVASVAYVAIRKAVRKAGVPEKGSYNHILRHTFASHAVMRGTPIAVVSKWLGHASIHMTMRYAHLAEGESHRMMGGFSLGSDPLQAPPAPAAETTPPPDGG